MKDNIIKQKLSFDGITTSYQLLIRCVKCGKEAESGNVFKAKYCPDCAKSINREQTRLRVKAWRERKLLRENGYE